MPINSTSLNLMPVSSAVPINPALRVGFLVRVLRPLSIILACGMFLSACAETQFVMQTAKRLGQTNVSHGIYKVGKPYKVAGVWYYPKVDWNYDQTGIASWYGPNFHKKTTANGELFDQWSVSAAHKTLPLPSVVRVTDLDNGRSLVVRVNDRGPFKPGRIIDLSRRAAQLLGFERKGTARVRVQILPYQSQIVAARAKARTGGTSFAQTAGTQLTAANSPIKSAPVTSKPVITRSLPALGAPSLHAPLPGAVRPLADTTNSVVTQGPASKTHLYIQAGAFSDIVNARRVKFRLNNLGVVKITSVPVNGKMLFRVRLGPINNVAEADRLLAQVFQAGYAGARTIVRNITTKQAFMD